MVLNNIKIKFNCKIWNKCMKTQIEPSYSHTHGVGH